MCGTPFEERRCHKRRALSRENKDEGERGRENDERHREKG